MGYTTSFDGQFDLDRRLAAEHATYLLQFSETRRMRRDASLTQARPDPLRVDVGMGVGREGGYFVGEGGPFGQERGDGVLDYDRPPAGQPSLWCHWAPNDDGSAIRQNGAEKFYGYAEWIAYIAEHFLGPWGYCLTGSVSWEGEGEGDVGTIVVAGNKVRVVTPVSAEVILEVIAAQEAQKSEAAK